MSLDYNLMDSHPDVAKWLKYAKDILHQLVQGGRRCRCGKVSAHLTKYLDEVTINDVIL
jgi:hypothetical protein